MPDRGARAPWWDDFFDDAYADFGLVARGERDEKARADVVEFVMTHLGLSPGQRVFDQCCGIGRLSIPLAERGVEVVGVDLQARYVERARAEAAARGLPCVFHQGDAFSFTTPAPCHAAINWFTSFGYSPDDQQNREMVCRAFESLVPGGRFALDYVNVPRILAEFRPSQVVRRAMPDGGELILLDEPTLDFAAGMCRATWTLLFPDGRREVRRIETRMYMPHELVALLEGAGFERVELHGSAAGEPFDRLSRRLIAVASRPG